MAADFLTVFSTFDLLTVSAASTVQRYLPYIAVLIRAVLLTLDSWLLSGHHLLVSNALPHSTLGAHGADGIEFRIRGELRHRVAVVHLGPFLAVTRASLHGGRILEAVLTYLAYAAGFSLLAGVA
jgi:hypothetical protein